MITRRLKKVEKKQLTFESDDPNYDPQSILVIEIIELWEVKGVFSTYINPPKMIEERVMLLEKKLDELAGRL